MIVCNACGYDNPLGRVFCHKCGTKLDLAKVRPPGSVDDSKGGKGSGAVTIGVKREEKKKGKSFVKTLIRIFDVVLIAVVAYCIFRIWQEPTYKSTGTSPNETEQVKLNREKLEFAIANKSRFKIILTDMAVNSYFQTVSDAGKSSDTGTFRTEKIQLLSEKDLIDIVYVRKIIIGSWEKRIIMQYWGRPIVDGGEFHFQPVRGRIGELGVPSFALGPYERNFARLFQNFDSERELLGKLTTIQVEPGKITLAYEPAK
jgi:hypothetical protein